MIPEINPEYTGAPDANEIPGHNGTATKKKVMLARRSCFVKDRKQNLIFRLLIMKARKINFNEVSRGCMLSFYEQKALDASK
jgi:hypothetical protein